MDNIVTGLIALSMLVVFLGFYAYKIISAPLWVIIAGILALAIYDLYDSIRKGQIEIENGD